MPGFDDFANGMLQLEGAFNNFLDRRKEIAEQKGSLGIDKLNRDFVARTLNPFSKDEFGQPNAVTVDNWQEELKKHNQGVDDYINNLDFESAKDPLKAAYASQNTKIALDLTTAMTKQMSEQITSDGVAMRQSIMDDPGLDSETRYLKLKEKNDYFRKTGLYTPETLQRWQSADDHDLMISQTKTNILSQAGGDYVQAQNLARASNYLKQQDKEEMANAFAADYAASTYGAKKDLQAQVEDPKTDWNNKTVKDAHDQVDLSNMTSVDKAAYHQKVNQAEYNQFYRNYMGQIAVADQNIVALEGIKKSLQADDARWSYDPNGQVDRYNLIKNLDSGINGVMDRQEAQAAKDSAQDLYRVTNKDFDPEKLTTHADLDAAIADINKNPALNDQDKIIAKASFYKSAYTDWYNGWVRQVDVAGRGKTTRDILNQLDVVQANLNKGNRFWQSETGEPDRQKLNDTIDRTRAALSKTPQSPDSTVNAWVDNLYTKAAMQGIPSDQVALSMTTMAINEGLNNGADPRYATRAAYNNARYGDLLKEFQSSPGKTKARQMVSDYIQKNKLEKGDDNILLYTLDGTLKNHPEWKGNEPLDFVNQLLANTAYSTLPDFEQNAWDNGYFANLPDGYRTFLAMHPERKAELEAAIAKAKASFMETFGYSEADEGKKFTTNILKTGEPTFTIKDKYSGESTTYDPQYENGRAGFAARNQKGKEFQWFEGKEPKAGANAAAALLYNVKVELLPLQDDPVAFIVTARNRVRRITDVTEQDATKKAILSIAQGDTRSKLIREWGVQ